MDAIKATLKRYWGRFLDLLANKVTLFVTAAYLGWYRLTQVEPSKEIEVKDIFKDVAHLFVGGLVIGHLLVRIHVPKVPSSTPISRDSAFYAKLGWSLVLLEVIAFFIGKYS